MSLSNFIKRAAKQDIVYWPKPSIDGYNRETFVTPSPIKGRWEDVKEIITSRDGEEVLSMARAYLTQEVEEGGYMYLGTTSDSEYDADPTNMDEALRIIAFRKLPGLGSTTDFVYRAHMNMGKSTAV